MEKTYQKQGNTESGKINVFLYEECQVFAYSIHEHQHPLLLQDELSC